MIEVRWGSHWTWMSCMRDQWSGRSQQRGMEGWQLCHGNLQPVSVGAQFTLPSLSLTDAACYVCKCKYMCSSEVHVVYNSWSNKRFLVYLKFFFLLCWFNSCCFLFWNVSSFLWTVLLTGCSAICGFLVLMWFNQTRWSIHATIECYKQEKEQVIISVSE